MVFCCEMATRLQGPPVCRISPGQSPRFSPSEFEKACFSITLSLDLTLSEKGVVAPTTSTVCIRIAGLISGKSQTDIVLR
jgi:hypothetical protein